MPVHNDNAFRSQVFREGVEQRRDQYSAQRQEAWRSLPDATVGTWQRTQAQQLDNMQSAEELASSQLVRQQAMEELAWARELHSDDMLQMQKESQRLALELQRVQTRQAQRQLDMDGHDQWSDQSLEEKAFLIGELDMVGRVQGGKFVYERPTDDEKSAAQKWLKSYRGYMDRRGTQSQSPYSLEIQRQMSVIEKMTEEGDYPEEVIQREKGRLQQMLRQRDGGGPGPGPGQSPREVPTAIEEFAKSILKEAERYGQ